MLLINDEIDDDDPDIHLTSFTSTLSTVTPQGSVASCSSSCISLAMDSRSDKMSPRFFVPNTFLMVMGDQSEASNQIT